ncbi:SCO family protein [Flavobacteriales bacterium]|nr:SCO family protein [Flavobacteriales bacterium]|tara:strand:+ start:4906 stop:5532 length:627 start_codon:yes stop_codon:yes gene_type:complete
MKYYYFILFLFLSCVESSNIDLPIIGPSDFKEELVDNKVNKEQSHFVSDFELINQNGDTITNKDYENKIYVVDFFFTRCGSICPIMTNNMKKIQDKFLENDNLMLLSISVTPNIDNVETLKKYAKSKGVINSKWNIATGNKKHIYELARKSYFAVLKKGDGGLQDFIHTPNFILIDKKKQIRGIYNGTDDIEIKRVINDIKTLQIKNS